MQNQITKQVLESLKKNPRLVARYIDHTEVSPNSTAKDVEKLCAEAKKYNFYSVMVLPYYAPLAKKSLKDAEIKIGAVIGFPFGVQCTKAKIAEMEKAYPFVDEFDVVINRPALKNKDYNFILKELKMLVRQKREKILKVIIESPELTENEIAKASELVLASDADFVKTAVGLRGPAKIKHIQIMKKIVGNKIKIKASGGIKNFELALAFLEAGASRIGTSHGIKIVRSKVKKGEGYFFE